MADETASIIAGAIAGGVVTLAIDGIKAFLNRRHLRLSAGITVRGGGGMEDHQAFTMTITNDGGSTMHIVRYGILRPAEFTEEDRQRKKKIRAMYRDVEGFRGRFRRIKLYDKGLFNFEEPMELAPGQQFVRKDYQLKRDFGALLGKRAVCYVEDTLGKIWTAEFGVTSLEEILARRKEAATQTPPPSGGVTPQS